MKNNLVRKVVLRHDTSSVLMIVLVLETAGGFSYGVDNYVSMPMSRRRALAKFDAVVSQYVTHQSFTVLSGEAAV